MELSQNVKVLRQLFCVLRSGVSIESVENFWIISDFGYNKPSPAQEQHLKQEIFNLFSAKRPEFWKDGFSIVRFPVSSRTFSD